MPGLFAFVGSGFVEHARLTALYVCPLNTVVASPAHAER